MSGTEKTTGGGSATPVGNDWMRFLQNGLETGQYGSTAPNPTNSPDINHQAGSGQTRPVPGYSNPDGKSGNPNGGMSTPGANPGGMNAFGDAINRILKGNDFGYSNPNNPTPTGYTPTKVGVDDTGLNDIIGKMQIFGQNKYIDQLGSTKYDTPTFENNTGGYNAPASLDFGGYSSNGLLGDRSNVTNAITGLAKTQRNDALAASRERFSQMGGNSNSTAAAYDEAKTQSLSDEALASSLAEHDLGYRNLDLSAYSAENSARLGAGGLDAQNFSTLLSNLTSSRNIGVNALTGASDSYAKSGALKEGNNKLNLDSALGFSKLNSDNMSTAGSLFNQLFGQNSNNLAGAGNLELNRMNTNQNANIADNDNNRDAATLDLNRYNSQGNLDLSKYGIDSSQLNSLLQMLFSSYNGAAGKGIPDANTVIEPNPIVQGVEAAGKVLPLLNFGARTTPAPLNPMLRV